ncbi:MAG TPA: cytochrome d ubiquinol oxidase subunit 2, partial [Pseudomonas sp.]|nr:cytochrome d ubiquinol oxidase subunit 2 [Pseudomonas sp.]
LRTDGALAERSRQATRLCALVFLLGFAAAGAWLVLGVEGFSQLSVSDPGAALNPLLDKQVAQDNAGWLANYGRYPVTLIAP